MEITLLFPENLLIQIPHVMSAGPRTLWIALGPPVPDQGAEAEIAGTIKSY